MRTTFDYELEKPGENDESETLTVEVEFTYDVDPSYGADADGNRGIRLVSLDDVQVKIFNEDGEDVTKMIEEKYPADYDAIDDMAGENAQTMAEEDDASEYGLDVDYDDLDD